MIVPGYSFAYDEVLAAVLSPIINVQHLPFKQCFFYNSAPVFKLEISETEFVDISLHDVFLVVYLGDLKMFDSREYIQMHCGINAKFPELNLPVLFDLDNVQGIDDIFKALCKQGYFSSYYRNMDIVFDLTGKMQNLFEDSLKARENEIRVAQKTYLKCEKRMQDFAFRVSPIMIDNEKNQSRFLDTIFPEVQYRFNLYLLQAAYFYIFHDQIPQQRDLDSISVCGRYKNYQIQELTEIEDVLASEAINVINFCKSDPNSILNRLKKKAIRFVHLSTSIGINPENTEIMFRELALRYYGVNAETFIFSQQFMDSLYEEKMKDLTEDGYLETLNLTENDYLLELVESFI